MQQRESRVQVVEGDANGSASRSIGSAVLVSPDVVVMSVANREAAPSLPLHVLVPVAAGGDRDEHINVTEVCPAGDGQQLVALRLEKPCAAELLDGAATARLMGAAPMSAGHALMTQDGGDLTTTGVGDWLCKIFRICR